MRWKKRANPFELLWVYDYERIKELLSNDVYEYLTYENREARDFELEDETVIPTEYNKEMFAYKNLCLSVADNIPIALQIYEEREMVDVYEWYTLKTAKDYKQHYVQQQMRERSKNGY